MRRLREHAPAGLAGHIVGQLLHAPTQPHADLHRLQQGVLQDDAAQIARLALAHAHLEQAHQLRVQACCPVPVLEHLLRRIAAQRAGWVGPQQPARQGQQVFMRCATQLQVHWRGP